MLVIMKGTCHPVQQCVCVVSGEQWYREISYSISGFAFTGNTISSDIPVKCALTSRSNLYILVYSCQHCLSSIYKFHSNYYASMLCACLCEVTCVTSVCSLMSVYFLEKASEAQSTLWALLYYLHKGGKWILY